MKTPTALQLSAWLMHEIPASLSSFECHASKLTRVYPLWYRLGDEGLAAYCPGAGDLIRQRVSAIAQSSGVEVWPAIAYGDLESGTMDAGRLIRMLGDRGCRGKHLQQLLCLAKADGVQGLNFDCKGFDPSYGKSWAEFFALARRACHGAGLKFALTIHPRVPLAQATFDDLGQVDLIQLAFGVDFPLGVLSGAIAAPWFAGQSLRQALAFVDASQLEFGFPGYGYATEAGRSQLLVWEVWEDQVRQKGPARRDPDTAELSLIQGNREAWYCDSVSILRKLLQARENGIGGAAFWVLGAEDPRLWEMLEDFPVPFAS